MLAKQSANCNVVFPNICVSPRIIHVFKVMRRGLGIFFSFWTKENGNYLIPLIYSHKSILHKFISNADLIFFLSQDYPWCHIQWFDIHQITRIIFLFAYTIGIYAQVSLGNWCGSTKSAQNRIIAGYANIMEKYITSHEMWFMYVVYVGAIIVFRNPDAYLHIRIVILTEVKYMSAERSNRCWTCCNMVNCNFFRGSAIRMSIYSTDNIKIQNAHVNEGFALGACLREGE